MLIPDVRGLEILLVLCLVDGLEDLQESAVVRLQDGVLRAQV